MKKIKRVALYDPYLDTLGGGERHILSLCQVLDELGYATDVLWDDPNILHQITDTLHLSFSHLRVVDNFLLRDSFWTKLLKMKAYDYLFYVTDGSYFFSAAKKNVIFAMVPQKDLYTHSFMNACKRHNFRTVANSHYTQAWLKKWGVESHVIYPYISSNYLKSGIEESRKKTILSVGRFFSHLHTKGHAHMIEWFALLQKNSQLFADYQLIIAGRVKDEDREYYKKIESAAQNVKGVLLMPNISERELHRLYATSRYYWHFAGMGVDAVKHPQNVEHLGITPLEAMASGCVPFCFREGGIREIISEGENGFAFQTYPELEAHMNRVASDKSLYKSIQYNGREFVNDFFSYTTFKKNVIAYLNL